MPEAIYILCTITSAVCAFFLIRGYRRTGMRLLFWSGLFFVMQVAANILLYIDLVVISSFSLLWARNLITLFGVMVLLVGLIWEAA